MEHSGATARDLSTGDANQPANNRFSVITDESVVFFERRPRDLSLAQAGLLASTRNLRKFTTVILWGALADRIGEPIVVTAGRSSAGSPQNRRGPAMTLTTIAGSPTLNPDTEPAVTGNPGTAAAATLSAHSREW